MLSYSFVIKKEESVLPICPTKIHYHFINGLLQGQQDKCKEVWYFIIVFDHVQAQESKLISVTLRVLTKRRQQSAVQLIRLFLT